MNNWSGKLQGIIVTFCFNQFPSGVGESALKGKKAAAKKGRDGESGCWWKWTLRLQSLHWHLLQLKTSFIPLPLWRFSVNLRHRGHFIHSHPIDLHASDMISLSLMRQFVESCTAIVVCFSKASCLWRLCCAAYVWARNWFTCQCSQKAAFITRKLTATCKNGGKVAMPDVIAPLAALDCYQISLLSDSP